MALSMDKIYQEILRDGGETPSKKSKRNSSEIPRYDRNEIQRIWFMAGNYI